MANDTTTPAGPQKGAGGRIDIVEDEDFSLVLDSASGDVKERKEPRLEPRLEGAADKGTLQRFDAQAEPGLEIMAPFGEVREVANAAEPVPVPPQRGAAPSTEVMNRVAAALRGGSADEAAAVPAAETPAPAQPVAPDANAAGAANAEAAAAAPTAFAIPAAAGAAAPAAAADYQPDFGGGAGQPPSLPLIGKLPSSQQIRVLLAILAFALVLGGLLIGVNAIYGGIAAQQTQIASDALMHGQRLGKAAPNAMFGNPDAFKQLEESRKEINAGLDQLARGGTWQGMEIARASSTVQALAREAKKQWERSDRAAEAMLKMRRDLGSYGATLQKLNAAMPQLQELAEQIALAKVQGGAPAREISAASQLALLIERITRGANQFIAPEGINPDVAFQLGRDVNLFRDIVDGFLRGSDTLRLAPAKEGDQRERLHKLQSQFEEVRGSISGVLGNLPRFVDAKQSELLIFSDNEALRQRLAALQEAVRAEQDSPHWSFWLLLGCIVVAVAAAGGIAMLLLQDSRQRVSDAEARERDAEIRRRTAEQHETEAKALNQRTQDAILRLMDELQKVADGDLTVQATVDEGITGAIADSVNYTVEELRGLVERVHGAAGQLAGASTQAQGIANGLLAASHQQARDIADIGQAVMSMAVQITDVSRAAVESAEVARLSVQAAREGGTAVGNTIAGMNEIRGHIQETAKRIKRLGESSQEIGEITELISDITEQTNVLALNAAIQAASAGEAGRGFSIVAEEVQRLAERSAAATKQIGALVRTIQNDTLDAIAAMERSTQGVVEGARLSDAGGAALAEILRVSHRLAELIQDISHATEQQATSANGVAQNIQSILGVTERTQEGTQQSAQSIRELATLAQELKSSVARFRVVQ